MTQTHHAGGVPPTASVDLEALLDRLALVAGAARTARIDDLRRRRETGRLRVLLVGEAKRGKSTLGNALLGREVLPTGVTPVTAVTTQVVPVTDEAMEHVDVVGRDGATSRIPVSKLAEVVSERGNPDNVRGVDDVVVHLRSRLGDLGVTLVDTPGVGSALAHNTEEAHAAYARMDAAVVVLTADPPASASELELLDRIRAASVRTFVVLNKVDRLDAAERREAVEYVAGLVPGGRVYACSARRAVRTLGADQLDGDLGEEGVTDLAADLRGYLATRGRVDLQRSLRRAAARIAADARDDCLVETAVVGADTDAQRTAVEDFLCRTAQLGQVADAAEGRVEHLHTRLRGELDRSARTEVARLVPVAADAVEDALAGRQGARVDELDAAARAALVDVVGPAVHGWQREHERRIREGVAGSVDREQQELEGACGAIREAAARLLHIELSVRGVEVAVPPVSLVPLDFSAEVGWAPPLAGAARRLLAPGRAFRTVAAGMETESRRLVDRQVGRARGQLQAEVDEAARVHRRSLAAAYRDAGTRFADVVHEARSSADRTTTSLQDQHAHLVARLAELDAILASLDDAGPEIERDPVP